MSQAALSGSARPEPVSRDPVLGYFQRSELPISSLYFVLPLIILYELGTRFVIPPPSGHSGETRIIAFTMMREFFGLFGATGRYLPCLAVVGILLAWHIARNDSWQVKWGTLLGMLVESALLAFPLLGLSLAITRYVPMAAPIADRWSMVVLSIGAGVYEELVFRLIAFTALNLLLIDVLRLAKTLSYLLMVLGSSILFSSYHYLGSEPFELQTFLFRTVAGMFFGGLFVFRGFGITAGCHAIYDIMVVLLPVFTFR